MGTKKRFNATCDFKRNYNGDCDEVNDKLEWHSEFECNDDNTMKINFLLVYLYKKEIEVRLAFYQLSSKNRHVL